MCGRLSLGGHYGKSLVNFSTKAYTRVVEVNRGLLL